MRDNIYHIIDDNCSIQVWDVKWLNKATDELTALMCYREVRAYCAHYRGTLNTIHESIVDFFKDSYSNNNILQAIEQVKNDMK